MNLIAFTPKGFEPAMMAASFGTTANITRAERTAPADAHTFQCMLEEVDYGIALVTCTGVLRYANQLALQSLAEAGALRLAGGMLTATGSADQAQLRCALADAARGLRRMLHLGDGAQSVSISVKPMASGTAANDAVQADGAAPAMAMLMFGKRQTCETLTLDIFARTQRLTGAETAVLRGLCSGQRPKQIASGAGVAVSTVRTQINSVRTKTHTNSIRELVDRVAALPPITPAMKSVVCH